MADRSFNMANANAPFGLRPARKVNGGNVSQSVYSVATNYATAIYDGDPVQMSGTGRNVILAEATNADNIGVFKGCSYKDSTGSMQFSHHWPGVSDGKTDIKAFVIDDPDVVYEIQADGCVEAEIGVVCDWNAGTGSTTSGLSGAYAVVSGTSATTGGSLRVMRLVDRPDNAYGAYAKIEVMFAEHVLGRVVSGVGGI
jgi:hypothetical protein